MERFERCNETTTLVRKFEQFKRGNNIVHAYYQEFKSYMHHCDIEESKDDTMNIFFGGLNHDTLARFQYIPRCITGMYVHACTFERQIHEDAFSDFNQQLFQFMLTTTGWFLHHCTY